VSAYHRERHIVIHHRWTLAKPAHHTDVYQALDAATRERDGMPSQASCSDVEVTGEDEKIVVFFTSKQKGSFVPDTAPPPARPAHPAKEATVEGRTAESW